MNPVAKYDIELAQSILAQLDYLLLPLDRLIIDKNVKIGSGGGGEVLFAQLRVDYGQTKPVAVKCIWNMGTLGDHDRFTARFVRELRAWVAVKHLNILPVLGFHISEDPQLARLVSPYMSRGNVKQYMSLAQPGLAQRMKLIRGLIAGVEHLHTLSPPLCHGDLKPGNVLVSDDEEATICDFGLAAFVRESADSSGLTTSHSIKGSTRYMSPELLLEASTRYTLPSDVWAWACTAFEIMTNCAPYYSAVGDPQIILAMDRKQGPGDLRILQVKTSNTSLSVLSQRSAMLSLKIVIGKAWLFFPALRPTMRDISRELSRPKTASYASNVGQTKGTVYIWISYTSQREFSTYEPVGRLGVCVKLDGVCRAICSCNYQSGHFTPLKGNAEEKGWLSVDDDQQNIVIEASYYPGYCVRERQIIITIRMTVKKLESPWYIPLWQHNTYGVVRGTLKLSYLLSFSKDVWAAANDPATSAQKLEMSRMQLLQREKSISLGNNDDLDERGSKSDLSNALEGLQEVGETQTVSSGAGTFGGPTPLFS